MKQIVRATVNSWNGLRAATSSEAAFRLELAVLVLSFPAAFLVTPEPWKRLALIGVIVLAVIVELLNTAIEKLADVVMPEHDPRIGRLKDMGSAAVGVTLLLGLAVWLTALIERLA